MLEIPIYPRQPLYMHVYLPESSLKGSHALTRQVEARVGALTLSLPQPKLLHDLLPVVRSPYSPPRLQLCAAGWPVLMPSLSTAGPCRGLCADTARQVNILIPGTYTGSCENRDTALGRWMIVLGANCECMITRCNP